MNDNKRASERREALVDNIGKREDLPPGWRGTYDQLIVDLQKIEPHLRVAAAKAKFGELRIYLESHPTRNDEAAMLIARAAAVSRATCEVCGQAGGGHYISEIYRRLCEAHLRAAQAIDAARLQIFEGNWADAEGWMHSRSLHLGETPADHARRSSEGLQKVLTLIAQIGGGVYP